MRVSSRAGAVRGQSSKRAARGREAAPVVAEQRTAHHSTTASRPGSVAGNLQRVLSPEAKAGTRRIGLRVSTAWVESTPPAPSRGLLGGDFPRTRALLVLCAGHLHRELPAVAERRCQARQEGGWWGQWRAAFETRGTSRSTANVRCHRLEAEPAPRARRARQHLGRAVDAHRLARAEASVHFRGQLARPAAEVHHPHPRVWADESEQVEERLAALVAEAAVLVGIPAGGHQGAGMRRIPTHVVQAASPTPSQAAERMRRIMPACFAASTGSWPSSARTARAPAERHVGGDVDQHEGERELPTSGQRRRRSRARARLVVGEHRCARDHQHAERADGEHVVRPQSACQHAALEGGSSTASAAAGDERERQRRAE